MFTMMLSVFCFATTTHRLHCFVPIFTLNPHITVVTLIIIKCSNSRYYYIAQRKNKVHTITGSNQTLTADIRNILCVASSRRYPEEQLDCKEGDAA